VKVYLHGRDNIGWSIDSDRKHTKKFLQDLGFTVTENFFLAQVIHSVWWNQLLKSKNWFLRHKRNIIATATNEIMPNNHIYKDYLDAKSWITMWVAPSKRQFDILKADGAHVAYQPFYVDEKVFKKADKSKEEIASLLGIAYAVLKNKFLIGSFQRDTLGTDLKSPKWQKGPKLLMKILSSLPDRDKWLLVLAGPRRHYVINECEKQGIPYYYCGKGPAPDTDDIGVNTLSHDKMALLYNLIDCYLVTSKSEGGPKAISEASFSETLIFSTDVGAAPDILDKRCLFDDVEAVHNSLIKLIRGEDKAYFNELTSFNFKNASAICSYSIMKNRLQEIYESI
jgi:hypothetical protein